MNCDFDGNRPAIRFPPTFFEQDCQLVKEILRDEQESHDIMAEDRDVR